MMWKFEDRPDWEAGKFRVTIAEYECRIKCNIELIPPTACLAVIRTIREAIRLKEEYGITCTVRSTDTGINFSKIKFYAEIGGKKEKLIEVERRELVNEQS